MRRNWLAILPLVLLIGIINNSIAEEVNRITYTGRVIDYNARPVAGATVVCYELQHKFSKYSFPSGTFSPRSYEPIGRTHTTSDGRFFLQTEKKTFLPSYLVAGKSTLALGWREIVHFDENIIRLGKPSRFKGTVVDEIGQPVQGARVRICLKDKMMMERREIAPLLPEGWFTTRTDARGEFLFDNIPEGATADFGVEAPGRALIWTTCDSGLGQGEQFAAGRTDICIVLPPEGCIQGRVVKQQTDEPVAGVQLLARSISHANRQNYQDQIYSDPNGRFVITGLAPGEHLLQTLSDIQGSGNITVTLEAGQTVHDVKVPLAGYPFEVIVYDEGKASPLEKANVTVKQKHSETKYTSYSQQKTTDANGLALFCAPPGDCEVQVTKLDYGTTMIERYNLTIDPRQTSRQEVSLPRSAIVLSGEVLDEKGQAVSGVSVMQTSFGPRTITDAKGHFDTSEFHYFSSRLPSKATMLARHIQSGLGAIGVLEDPTKSGRPHGRIILKPAFNLTGNVTDPTGKSIPAAYVKLLEGSNNAVVSEVATDPNGIYYFRSVPPPQDKLEYAIVARTKGYGQTAANQFLFHDDTAQPVQIDPIILLPADEVISGIVMDSNDQPVADVRISVHGPKIIRNYNWFYYGHTITDEKGRYRITGVPKEPLFINAWSSLSKQRGETMVNGGNENVRVVLGQNLIFSPSLKDKPLPELKDLEVNLSSANIRDKMMLICFFDMEQRPSRNCIIQLTKKAEQLKQKGIICVAVQASKIDENKLNEWIKKYNIPFPAGMIESDQEKIRFTWGVKSLPWLILTDNKHIVRAEGFALSELDEKISAITQR